MVLGNQKTLCTDGIWEPESAVLWWYLGTIIYRGLIVSLIPMKPEVPKVCAISRVKIKCVIWLARVSWLTSEVFENHSFLFFRYNFHLFYGPCPPDHWHLFLCIHAHFSMWMFFLSVYIYVSTMKPPLAILGGSTNHHLLSRLPHPMRGVSDNTPQFSEGAI